MKSAESPVSCLGKYTRRPPGCCAPRGPSADRSRARNVLFDIVSTISPPILARARCLRLSDDPRLAGLNFCLLAEPKKRRFHPLRGLRKIFRRKSRGAADVRLVSTSADRDAELARVPREETTVRHPAGRHEEARSRSASELLTDSCDRER